MERRPHTLAAAISLLLCAATAALWVRSHTTTDMVSWRNKGGARSVRTATGSLEIALLLADWTAEPPQQFHAPQYQRDLPRPPFNWILLMGGSTGDTLADWQHAGFAWHQRRNARLGTLHAIAVVPFWAIAAATAALPLAWTTARLRSRARRHPYGLCRNCGYDLTGNVSGICPECGTPAQANT